MKRERSRQDDFNPKSPKKAKFEKDIKKSEVKEVEIKVGLAYSSSEGVIKSQKKNDILVPKSFMKIVLDQFPFRAMRQFFMTVSRHFVLILIRSRGATRSTVRHLNNSGIKGGKMYVRPQFHRWYVCACVWSFICSVRFILFAVCDVFHLQCFLFIYSVFF